MVKSVRKQSGAVLIIALVILGVTTLLGVSVMQSSTVNAKMATNSQERQQAFSAAEAAMREAENRINLVGFADASFRSSCNPTSTLFCFTSGCTGGLCFTGVFGPGDQQKDCSVVPASGTPSQYGVWEDPVLDVWNTAGRFTPLSVNLPGYGGITAGKYIIEFRCFVDTLADPNTGTKGLVTNGNGDVYYRVTARGTSKTGRVDVMLQSAWRSPAP